MTVERGIDPRELALVAFGGAGPLHAAGIADELGMDRVIVPRAAGVLSALGLALSERRRDVVRSVLMAGDELTREAVATAVRELGERGRRDLGEAGAELRASYDLRYAGQAFELSVDGPLEPDPAGLRESFDAAHESRYGYADPDAELELVSVRVAAATPGADLPEPEPLRAAERSTRAAVFGGERLDTAVFGRRRGRGRRAGDLRAARLHAGGPAGLARARRRERRWRCTGEPRPGRPPGDARRAARRLRRDGRRARPLGALGQHQGAPRRLHRAIRRARPHGDAGRAHPGPPRRHALGRGGGAR